MTLEQSSISQISQYVKPSSKYQETMCILAFEKIPFRLLCHVTSGKQNQCVYRIMQMAVVDAAIKRWETYTSSIESNHGHGQLFLCVALKAGDVIREILKANGPGICKENSPSDHQRWPHSNMHCLPSEATSKHIVLVHCHPSIWKESRALHCYLLHPTCSSVRDLMHARHSGPFPSLKMGSLWAPATLTKEQTFKRQLSIWHGIGEYDWLTSLPSSLAYFLSSFC